MLLGLSRRWHFNTPVAGIKSSPAAKSQFKMDGPVPCFHLLPSFYNQNFIVTLIFTTMSETTNLYLLIFPKHRVLKVGKANDINRRIQTLKRWWGDVDYEASYYLTNSPEVIFKLEKSLHFFLSVHSVPFSEGDGRTELFSTQALEIALRHIEILCATAPNIKPVIKGVPRPLIESPSLIGKQVTKYKRLASRSDSIKSCVTEIAEKFHRINRILLILLRKQASLAYQYDIVGDHLYFRLYLPRNKRLREDSSKIMMYFHFDLEDYFGHCGINFCSSTVGIGDTIQFNIRMLTAEDGTPRSELFSYFFQQSEYILKKIPQCSPAAKEPICIIDESMVFNDILQLSTN